MALKETTEMLDFAMALVKAGADAEADGKIDLNDVALLFPLFPAAQAAFQGVGQIPSELASMSDEDAAQLIAHVMSGLAVSDPKARQVIDASLKFLSSGYDLYKAIKA